MAKYLGKITSVKFGFNDRNWFGLSLDFSTKEYFSSDKDPEFVPLDTMDILEASTGVGSWLSVTDPKFLIKLERIMRDANVDNLQKLLGTPVVVEIVDNTLKSWRVLKEVI